MNKKSTSRRIRRLKVIISEAQFKKLSSHLINESILGWPKNIKIVKIIK
jgi:hypothetical protein